MKPTSVPGLQEALRGLAATLAFRYGDVPRNERGAAACYRAFLGHLALNKKFCRGLLSVDLDMGMSEADIRSRLQRFMDRWPLPSPVDAGREHWTTLLAAVLTGLHETIPTLPDGRRVEILVVHDVRPPIGRSWHTQDVTIEACRLQQLGSLTGEEARVILRRSLTEASSRLLARLGAAQGKAASVEVRLASRTIVPEGQPASAFDLGILLGDVPLRPVDRLLATAWAKPVRGREGQALDAVVDSFLRKLPQVIPFADSRGRPPEAEKAARWTAKTLFEDKSVSQIAKEEAGLDSAAADDIDPQRLQRLEAYADKLESRVDMALRRWGIKPITKPITK